MKEYKVVYHKVQASLVDEMESVCNELAKQGWELDRQIEGFDPRSEFFLIFARVPSDSLLLERKISH